MKRPAPHTRFLWRFAPLVLLLCACLPKIWQGDFNVDTGAYSAYGLQAWRAAIDHGDWGWLWTLRGVGGDPSAGGTFYFNKPPLPFWIHGLALFIASMGGGPASILVARLPSVLAAGLSILFAMNAARTLSGRRAACIAGCVMATSLHLITYARAFSLDLWQLSGLAFMLWMVAKATVVKEPSRRLAALWMAAAGLGLGGALMCKPLAALVSVPIVLVWLLIERRFVLAAMLTLTLTAAAVVAGPWHLSMWLLHGEAFTNQYIGNQIVERARGVIGTNVGAEHWWYYLAEIGRTGWPWLALVPLAGWAAWKSVRGRSDGPHFDPKRALVSLASIWFTVWLILLSSFADKRPRYLSVLAPSVGWLWEPAILAASGPLGTFRRAASRWILPIALAAAIAVSLLPIRVHSTEPPDWTTAIDTLRKMSPADRHQIWAGSLSPMGSSRFYLALGFWPRPTVDYAKKPLATPAQVGSVLVYESNGDTWPLRPGPGETVILDNARIVISRVDTPPWRPVAASAPLP